MTELAPLISVEPAALRFARERCVEQALDQLGSLTAELFPDANSVRAELLEDSDVPNVRWISFQVEVDWNEPERVRRIRNAWYERTARAFPSEILANFGLDIDRRPG